MALEHIYVHSFWRHSGASIDVEVLEIGFYALHEITLDFGLEIIDLGIVPALFLLQFPYESFEVC